MSSTTLQCVDVTKWPLPNIHIQSTSPTLLSKVKADIFTIETPQDKRAPLHAQLEQKQQQQPEATTSFAAQSSISLKRKSPSPATLENLESIDTMSSNMSRNSSQSSKKSSLSPPTKRAKVNNNSNEKEIDWADVTDPEERRRIQNRIAQRKFREKARETKEKAERESRNQQNAGNSYRIPTPSDISNDQDLSGLPWGSVNLCHVVSRGYERESKRSSGRATYVGDDNYQTSSGFGFPAYTPRVAHAPSYGGSSGDEDVFGDETSYLYSAATPLPAFPVQ